VPGLTTWEYFGIRWQRTLELAGRLGLSRKRGSGAPEVTYLITIFNAAFIFLACRMPSPIRGFILRSVFQWDIHPSARIGLSLFVNSGHVELAADARIGHFTVFKDIRRLSLGNHTTIGNWNWLSSAPVIQGATCSITIGEHSSITSRHYIDATGGVDIGAFVTLAGHRGTVLSHQIDLAECRQQALPIRIGDYCLIGSDVRFVPGAAVGDYIQIAMGSVVVGHLSESYSLYGGVPARNLRAIPKSAAYFSRGTGAVR